VAELISKTEGALQELEESAYWLELLHDSGILEARRIENLIQEADEFTAILVSGVKSLKMKRHRK